MCQRVCGVNLSACHPVVADASSSQHEEVAGAAPAPAPRARMVRMRVGQTPDWDKIDSDKVLEAWTASGGDVQQMAAILSNSSPNSTAGMLQALVHIPDCLV